MNFRARQFLRDALIEAENLAGDLHNVAYQSFEESRQLRRITERSLEIVGESIRRSFDAFPEFRASHPELGEWISLRNVLSHKYDIIRPETLWAAATLDLTRLIPLLESITHQSFPD